MARSNYQFNKRQKEVARKKKKEQKRQRKLDKNTIKSEENPNQSQNEGENLWGVCEHILIGSASEILLKPDKIALCRLCTVILSVEDLHAVYESHLMELIKDIDIIDGIGPLEDME